MRKDAICPGPFDCVRILTDENPKDSVSWKRPKKYPADQQAAHEHPKIVFTNSHWIHSTTSKNIRKHSAK